VTVTAGANRAPTLNAISNMTVNEGATTNQVITGSDPDGNALTFTKTSGPTFETVTTTNATSGNIALAPGFSDAGTAASTVTVTEGATANQVITGSDPDGDALTFTKAAGPTYMTVTTTNATSGNIALTPGFSDAGTAAATVTATDNGTPALSNSRSFTITVNNVNRAPSLNAIANMSVAEGATADQVITGSDPDGDALKFRKAAGPTSGTVTTTNETTGNVHVAPGFGDAAQAYAVT